jgi:hypothetical protein
MDWSTLQTPFFLQPGQSAKMVTLNIVINGKGTVWVDDVHLLKEPLRWEPNPSPQTAEANTFFGFAVLSSKGQNNSQAPAPPLSSVVGRA